MDSDENPSLLAARSSAEDVLAQHGVDQACGLSRSEVDVRMGNHGPNELEQEEDEPLYMKFLDQFKDPLIGLLLASALVSLLVRQYDDAISIALAVVIVSTVAFVQEYKSEQSLAALTKLIPPRCHCLRDGRTENIEARELVPGDIVVLQLGDRVPADCRVVSCTDLLLDESSLTGESVLMEKSVKAEPWPSPISPGTPVTNPEISRTLLFMGTTVNNGHGRAIVVSTGMKTEFGKTFQEMKDVQQRKTPLQVSMDQLGKKLSIISFGVIGVIAVIGLIRGQKLLNTFTVGVSLAVAAIPEGLPICVTVTLALGVMRMAQRKAIVKKLPAVEALGCATVICVDKTGTLTQNEMTVAYAVCPGFEDDAVSAAHSHQSVEGLDSELDRKLVHFTGVGMGLEGRALLNGRQVDVHDQPVLERLMETAVLCNNSNIRAANEDEDGVVESEVDAVAGSVLQSWGLENLTSHTVRSVIIGQKTEAALLLAAIKCGLKDPRHKFDRISEVAFSSERKRMEVKCRAKGGGKDRVFVKGVVDGVLDQCVSYYHPTKPAVLTDAVRQRMLAAAQALAARGLRVLGVAHGESMGALIFDGLIAMADPPRKGLKVCIEALQASRARLCMITGDSKETAISIASQLGFYDATRNTVLSGQEMDELSSSALEERISQVAVFYRTTPRHKLAIVQALQKVGEVVSMTGDGVNDAPALSAADIGVAMGKTGTDVAKEAADMIILDDSFATIVAAVEEGKSIFYNIKNFLTFQLSTSVAALSIVAISNLTGMPTPLNAMQILWINIIMDGPPAQSLGVEPVDAGVVRRPPRRHDEPIINSLVMWRVLSSAFLITLGTLYVHRLGLVDGKLTNYDTTKTFTTFVFFDMANALCCRSMETPVFRLSQGFFSNHAFLWAVGGSIVGQLLVIYSPPMQKVFQTAPLTLNDLVFIACLASTLIVLDTARKLFPMGTTDISTPPTESSLGSPMSSAT